MARAQRSTRRPVAAAARVRAAVRAGARAARRHPWLLVVLAPAVALRVAAGYAYWPGLFITDSWQYLKAGVGGANVGAMPDRPSGYPMLMHLERTFGPADTAQSIVPSMVVLQHLAGLAGGIVVYALLVKLGVRRLLATFAAALILLDSWAISLEQNLQPESLFSLALLVSAALLALWRRHWPAVAASGLVLAGAATLRPAALFAIPVCLAYVIRHCGLRGSAVAVAALAIPLVAYAAWYEHNTGTFGMSRADGWFLYGRIAPISTCRGVDVPAGAKPLCATSPAERQNGPGYFVWNAASPAVRTFGLPGANSRANSTLKSFAFAVIRARPGDYARVVLLDFLRFFHPGGLGGGAAREALTFPPRTERTVNVLVKDSVYQSYRMRARAPSSLLRAYQRVFHTVRWLLVLLVLAALSSVAVACARTRIGPRRGWETLLLVGMPLAVLVGSVATVQFDMRYLLSVMALLVAGGVLGIDDLWAMSDRLAQRRGGWRWRRPRATPRTM